MTERLAYSPQELADAVGLSRKAIYRAIERGELPAKPVCGGSRLLIQAEVVGAWLAPDEGRRNGQPGQLAKPKRRQGIVAKALADLDQSERVQ